jgi:hypothetical protein
VNTAPNHDWKVVAPWWKWPNPRDSQSGRLSRPELQKYESSRLVDDFIKNPQRSLKWTDEDLVHVVKQASPIPLGSNGKPRRFTELEYAIDPIRTRKIFLDTHKRFYLVVCQIHCDAPGFPRADRADLCQAGFVVRRRTTSIPLAGAREINGILKRLTSARGKLGVLDTQAGPSAMRFSTPASHVAAITATASAVSTGGVAVMAGMRAVSIQRQRASTRALVEVERGRLQEWVNRFGVTPQLEGWFADPDLDKVGTWSAVDANPESLNGESVFPMYPLIAPPADKDHAGKFGTLYFGLLPTGSSDTDTRGSARFDDRQFYEVTCFATRHKRAHDRSVACPCPDGIFWSQPSAPYRLAAHFDVAGTGKRPVTIQMPDLDELAAQAAPSLGVSFAKPPKSLMIRGKKDGSPGARGRTPSLQICSFSIPLITIVASFVLELFLPVVVLLFGLWWMLKLKFCILPEIELSAALAAEFSISPATASISAEAAIAADVNATIDSGYGKPGFSESQELIDALKSDYSPIATANMQASISAAASGNGPNLSAGIEFEAEVAHP